MLDSKKAKRLGKYFANWVAQTKNGTMRMMKKLRMVPVMHACGDNSLCAVGKDNWCQAVRAPPKKAIS